MNQLVKKTILKIFDSTSFAIVKKMVGLKRKRRFDFKYNDYIRHSMLELMAHEIYSQNIEGSAAEVGVYKGIFASYMNKAFPDRKLYLFDTFNGFDEKDINVELQNNYTKNFPDFSETSIESVLDKMIYKENCVIKEGYFPDSLQGLEDKFVFVSLDTDLYTPIYAGLEYFYPRMSKGGAIFVHDYNNNTHPGVNAAVNEFCKKNKISFIPLCDSGGTVIIVK